MPLTGVAGFPVAHSRSPQMHNAAFRALGLDDWLYVHVPVAPSLFAEVARSLHGSGYVGVNVTIPHKHAALAVADSASPAAREIGAANTLSFEGDAIHADNTDAQGFLDALGEPVAGRRALILGAGGAARAVAWALRRAGAAEISVWNRTPERARRLAADLGLRSVASPEPADLLVNATAVGLEGSASDLPLDQVGHPELVADLVYADEPPAVTAWALARGMRIVGGLELLVRQGALTFQRWTAKDPPIDVMREAVRSARTPSPMRVPFR
ncbi:MAG: shikimate dehydrogenase [Thermoleophilaceae bacterium]